MNGPQVGPLDLSQVADAAKERAANERMAVLQMLLSLQNSGVSVFGGETLLRTYSPNDALAVVHDQVKKWHGYIFQGQAIAK